MVSDGLKHFACMRFAWGFIMELWLPPKAIFHKKSQSFKLSIALTQFFSCNCLVALWFHFLDSDWQKNCIVEHPYYSMFLLSLWVDLHPFPLSQPRIFTTLQNFGPIFFLTLNISQLAILQNKSLWLLLTYFGLHLSSSSSSSSSLWLDCGSRSLTKSQLPLSFHRSSYLGTRCSSWSREANRPTTGRRDVIDKHRLTASGFWAHVSIKSEIVADGSASQMAANNCPLGKSIWRLWSLIFSSHDTRLQISNARSELIAFKHNTSCPSNV